MRVTVRPLSSARWKDLELLFGQNGACAGCWCMFWRLEEGERFDDVKGSGAKRRMKALVASGAAKGYLAYAGTRPVGWLAAGPRRDFKKLDRAPSLQCSDADQVTALPCFFIHKDFRSQGVATALLAFAMKDLKAHGAKVLEAYPLKPARPGEAIAAAFAYTGTLSLFQKAGFTVVEPRAKGKQRTRRVL